MCFADTVGIVDHDGLCRAETHDGIVGIWIVPCAPDVAQLGLGNLLQNIKFSTLGRSMCSWMFQGLPSGRIRLAFACPAGPEGFPPRGHDLRAEFTPRASPMAMTMAMFGAAISTHHSSR